STLALSTLNGGLFSAMPRKSGFTINREISLGTIIHILALLLSTLWFADRFALRQEQLVKELRANSEKLERIEKYLSSKDPRYWQRVREFSNPREGEK